MQAVDSYGSTNNFKSCSFNISITGSTGFVSNSWSYIGLKDCYLKIKTVNDATIFGTSRDTFVDGCYIEANAPLGTYNIVKNSVCDLTTSATFTLSGNSSNALNIFNTDHAPNATAGGGFAGVSDENWLNTTYLNEIGINAGGLDGNNMARYRQQAHTRRSARATDRTYERAVSAVLVVRGERAADT